MDQSFKHHHNKPCVKTNTETPQNIDFANNGRNWSVIIGCEADEQCSLDSLTKSRAGYLKELNLSEDTQYIQVVWRKASMAQYNYRKNIIQSCPCLIMAFIASL